MDFMLWSLNELAEIISKNGMLVDIQIQACMNSDSEERGFVEAELLTEYLEKYEAAKYMFEKHVTKN